MTALPSGTVTFLFTDVEGRTRLLEAAPAAYRAALARHDALLERIVAERGGVIFQRGGDAIHAAFTSPVAAGRAAPGAQVALPQVPVGERMSLKVRMGIHTGEAELQGDQYFGMALHRCARLMSSAHG